MLREGAGLSRLAGSLFEVTGLAENTIVQRVAALVIGLGGQQDSTVLAAIAALVKRAPETLHSERVLAVFPGDDEVLADAARRRVLPVIVRNAVHFVGVVHNESLVYYWSPAHRTGEAFRVEDGLHGASHTIRDHLIASPASLQSGLIAWITYWYALLVVVKLSCQRVAALPAGEAGCVIHLFHCLYGLDSRRDCLVAKSTYIC